MELVSLQFGTLYETFLSQWKSRWLDRCIAQIRQVIRRGLVSLWQHKWLLIILFALAIIGFAFKIFDSANFR
jgi:hypothetical protein